MDKASHLHFYTTCSMKLLYVHVSCYINSVTVNSNVCNRHMYVFLHKLEKYVVCIVITSYMDRPAT